MRKDVILLFDRACIYEVVALNFYMNFSGCEMVFCSMDGKPIRSMEGYSMNVDMSLDEIDRDDIRSFTIPGGDVSALQNEKVKELLCYLNRKKVLVAAICAGVDILDECGILESVVSTHSSDKDFVVDENIVTARANAYIDFAIEVAKKLDLFTDEIDLQETIDFWKFYKRVQ